MRITVADAISPSYFVAIAAVQLGFFKEEGVEMEFVFPPADPSQALRDGVVDFYGGSPYTGLHRFPAGEAAPSCAPFRIIPIGSCSPLRSQM